MKRIINSFAALLLCAGLFLGCNKEADAPYGLMTDLMEHTDTDFDGQWALIRSESPSFSWIVPGEGMQTAYQIVASETRDGKKETVCWDSGKVECGASVSVPAGFSVKPSAEYSWKVKVWTKAYGEAEGEVKEWDWSEEKIFKTAETVEKDGVSYYPLTKHLESSVSVSSASNGNLLFDFGKDAFGQLEITLASKNGGETVTIHLGEQLKDGEILRKPTTTVRYQRHEITLEKGRKTYRIEVTPDKRNTGRDAVKMPEYIGEVMPFRYCEVEGLDENAGKAVKTADVRRYNVHYPFNMEAASFKCDNEVLNAVWELCRYSMQATSFTGIYIDGDRERIPYEADALINQLSHYGADREFSMARRSLEHLLLYPTWPTEWILQSIIIAWNDYRYTGDKRLLGKQYELLKAHSLLALKQANGLISTREQPQTEEFLSSINRNGTIRDIVDWPQRVPMFDGIPGGSDGFVFTNYNVVVNAYWCYVLRLMCSIADINGDQEGAEMYRAEAENALKAFNETFLCKEQGLYVDGIGTDHISLHANLFPLAFGLVPQEYRKTVSEYVASRGMSCGVYVAQFLLEALYESGQAEAALKLMTATGTISWWNMIEKGSTITMEAWDDAVKPNQDWNHAWGAAPGNIIPFRMMGVQPLEPGLSSILIKPQTAFLKDAEMKLPTIRGDIFMSIHKEEGKTSVKLGIPANTSGRLMFPADGPVSVAGAEGEFEPVDGFVDLGEIGPGEHLFEITQK